MQTYEYSSFDLGQAGTQAHHEKAVELLNRAGAAGWKLVSTCHLPTNGSFGVGGKIVYYMERPAQSRTPPAVLPLPR